MERQAKEIVALKRASVQKQIELNLLTKLWTQAREYAALQRENYHNVREIKRLKALHEQRDKALKECVAGIKPELDEIGRRIGQQENYRGPQGKIEQVKE